MDRRIFSILCKESVSLYICVNENCFSQVNLCMKTYSVGVWGAISIRAFFWAPIDGRISPFFKQRRLSNWNLAFILMIENMLWMLKRIASVRRFFRAPKTNVEIDWWEHFFPLFQNQSSYLWMKICRVCSWEPSHWRQFFWTPMTKVKIDGFENFSNFIWSFTVLIKWCDIKNLCA